MNKKFLNKKNIIKLSALFILIILILVFFYIKKEQSDPLSSNEDGIQYNTNKGITEDKEANGLIFTNIKCSYDGKNSLFTYTIINKTNDPIHLGEYELLVKDKEGNVLTTINPNLDYEIQVKEELEISNEVNIDLSNAYTMEFSLINNNNLEE